jgi:hypothetical protein
MSHTATAKCNIMNANGKTLAACLVHVCRMFDGRIKAGTRVLQYSGRTIEAKGTILAGLSIGAYGTDVDVSIDAKGTIIVTGDAVSANRITQEIEKAYKAEAYRQALLQQGLRTKMTINKASRGYTLEAVN